MAGSAQGQDLTLSKRADRPSAATGDLIHYAITVRNDSARDFTRAVDRPIFVLDIPAHGLGYLRNRVVARVRVGDAVRVLRPGEDGFDDAFEDPQSNRIVRFGPLDLPAGATLNLAYTMVVGTDTRPGHYENRAVVMDGAGVELSLQARTRVLIGGDPTLEGATVVGRVRCVGPDQSRGRLAIGGAGDDDVAERGVMGARVYLDTGGYAVTDRHGRYHFSTVSTGSRLIKLDRATLAGGQPAGPASRLVRLSSGAIERVDFVVECADELVSLSQLDELSRADGGSSAPSSPGPSAARPALEVRGGLDPLAVEVDGRSIALPLASVTLEVPQALRIADRNLRAVPQSGYSKPHPSWTLAWRPPPGVGVARWAFRIAKVDAAGAGSVVRTYRGTGAMPTTIAWDGLDESGALAPAGSLYSAQLVVIGDARGAEAASARRAFGVGYGLRDAASREEIWRGRLFRTRRGRPRARSGLRSRVKALAATVPPDARVEVEAHADGTGSRMAERVQTQREADLVAKLLAGAGIAAGRITARGRGSLEPLQRGRTRPAREMNRRMVIRVIPPGTAAEPVPEAVLATGQDAGAGDGADDVLLAGETVPVDSGRFHTRVRLAPGERVVLDLQARDGRRAAIEIAMPRADGPGATTSSERAPPTRDPAAKRASDEEPAGGAGRAAGPESTSIEIRGDLATLDVRVDERSIDLRSLWVDTKVARPGTGVGEPDFKILQKAGQRRLVAPIEFSLEVPASVGATGWQLVVRDSGGQEVFATGGATQGRPVPGSYSWNGAGRDSPALAVSSGQRYSVRLRVVGRDGHTSHSPERHFTVDAAPAGRFAVEGAFFDARGKVTEALRSELGKLAGAIRAAPPGDRIDIALRVAALPGVRASKLRLAVAVRRTMVERELEAAGVARERFAVQTSVGEGDRDRVSAQLPATRAPAAAPRVARVFIDGVELPLEGGRFRHTVTVSGQPIAIDITEASGHRVVARVEPPPVQKTTTSGGDADESTERIPLLATTRSGSVEEPVKLLWTSETRLWLPRAGAVLQSDELAITGATVPGQRIFAGAAREGQVVGLQEIPVDAEGDVAGAISLPGGADGIVVEVRHPDGRRGRFHRPVSLADRRLFVMALGEGLLSSSYITSPTGDGWSREPSLLSGMTEDSVLSLGPLLLHGRLTLYARGRFSGGPIAEHIDVTAHLDSARPDGSGPFFASEDLRHGLPTHGDDATEVRDAETRGKVFVEARAGSSRAVIGSVASDLRGGELFRYERTTSGALVVVDRSWEGDGARPGGEGEEAKDSPPAARIELRGFTGKDHDRLLRDINWYRATGGSLYYLRHGHVMAGSEKVRAVARDAQNGVVVAERVLRRGQDYRIDYLDGRIFLTRPLAMSAASGWLLDDGASSAPVGGDPVYLEVGYEYADREQLGETASDRASGVHGRVSLGPVSLGGGIVGERRVVGDDYTLWGAQAELRAGPRSGMSVEVAGSRHRDASNVLSLDGGLSFSRLDGIAPSLGATGDDFSLGWRVVGTFHPGDFLADNRAAEATRMTVHAQRLARDFSSGGTLLDQGRLKLGATLGVRLGEGSSLTVRHDSLVADVPQVGPTRTDVMANPDPGVADERTWHRTAVQWSLERGRFHHQVEAGHFSTTSSARLADGSAAVDSQRLGAGAASSFALTERLRVRLGQRALFGLRDGDPQLSPIIASDSDDGLPDSSRRDSEPLAGVATTAGAELALTEDVSLAADWSQRWNGDRVGQLGLRSSLSQTGSVHVSERVTSDRGRTRSTTVVGAEDSIPGSAGGKTYGEYQVEHGRLGRRDRAVLGLGQRWDLGPGLQVATGYEHQRVLGGFLPDGTPIGSNQRDVAHAGFTLSRPEGLDARVHLEVRRDSGEERGVEDIAIRDPRPEAPSGTLADHGGVTPGAPLILTPGEHWQVAGGFALTWKIGQDHTLLSRASAGQTVGSGGGAAVPVAEAAFVQATGGWGYRPLRHDWLDLLTRYSYIRDKRPGPDPSLPGGLATGTSPTAAPVLAVSSSSHIVAVVPVLTLPRRLTLAGKLAWKRVHSTASLPEDPAGVAADPGSGTSSGEIDGELDTEVDSILWLARLGYRVFGNWDASTELRGLHLSWSSGGRTVRESRLGWAVELGYTLEQRVRLGLGYNFSRIADDEFSDLRRSANGVFLRLTGYY